MRTTFYLYVRKYGDYGNRCSIRTTLTKQATRSDEVMISMGVEIPDDLFIRPSLTANVVIPPEAVKNQITAEVINNFKEVIKNSVDFKVNFEGDVKEEEVYTNEE